MGNQVRYLTHCLVILIIIFQCTTSHAEQLVKLPEPVVATNPQAALPEPAPIKTLNIPQSQKNTNETPTDSASTLKTIEALINNNQAAEALKLADRLIATDPSFSAYIAAGQSSAMLDNPQQALRYYQQALNIAQNPPQKRVAMLGMAKMQTWLGYYLSAEASYRFLLTTELSKQDYEIVLDGLVRNLTYQDKGKQALQVIPANLRYTNPSLVIAVAQAYYSIGSYDAARKTIADHQTLLQQIQPGSSLSRQLTKLMTDLMTVDSQKFQDSASIMQKMPYISTDGISIIKKLIEQDKGADALKLAVQIMKVHSNYDVYILAGQSSAMINQPQQALNYYQQASKLAVNEPQKKAATFGSAKMLLWLEAYKQAETQYRYLFKLSLNPQEYEIALDGLVRSLTSQDKGKEAFELIPKNFHYTTPSMVIAASQAALSAGYVDQAKKIIADNQNLLKQLPVNSNLFQQLVKLQKNIQSPPKKALAKKAGKKKAKEEESDPRFAKLIKLGNKYFDKECLDKALDYYHTAYQYIVTEEDQITALFSFGKVYLAKGDNFNAEKVYTDLLQYALKPEDYEVALNGYVRSVSALDRPIQAYNTIPVDFYYQSENMLIGATQAAAWAGWLYKAEALLCCHPKLLMKIKPDSNLHKQWAEVAWQTAAAMNTNKMFVSTYSEDNTDTFSIRHYKVGATHKFTKLSTSGMYIDKAGYMQNVFVQNNRVLRDVKYNGYALFATHNWRANDYLEFITYFGVGDFPSWTPLIWLGNMGYKPNDFMRLDFFNKNEMVEAFPALFDHISLNSTELAATFEPLYGLYVSGVGFHHAFTNHNIREGVAGRASYLLFNNFGLTVEIKGKRYNNSNPNNGEYFSPAKYEEQNVLLKLNRRLGTVWRYYVQYGKGRQKIEENPYVPTYQYEFGMRGPICNKFVLDWYYGYTNAAGTSGTGFARHYLGAILEILL